MRRPTWRGKLFAACSGILVVLLSVVITVSALDAARHRDALAAATDSIDRLRVALEARDAAAQSLVTSAVPLRDAVDGLAALLESDALALGDARDEVSDAREAVALRLAAVLQSSSSDTDIVLALALEDVSAVVMTGEETEAEARQVTASTEMALQRVTGSAAALRGALARLDAAAARLDARLVDASGEAAARAEELRGVYDSASDSARADLESAVEGWEAAAADDSLGLVDRIEALQGFEDAAEALKGSHDRVVAAAASGTSTGGGSAGPFIVRSGSCPPDRPLWGANAAGPSTVMVPIDATYSIQRSPGWWIVWITCPNASVLNPFPGG